MSGVELPRRGVRVDTYPTAVPGRSVHVAVCACGWKSARHVVKAAALDEARWHRAKPHGFAQ